MTAPSNTAADCSTREAPPPEQPSSPASASSVDRPGRWPLWLRLTVVALAVSALGFWVWEEIKYDYFVPKRWGAVESGSIYRSGLIAGHLQEPTLQEHGIDVIVTMLGEEPDNPDQATEARLAESMDIDLYRYPMGGDGVGELDMYVGAVQQMVEAQRRGEQVLVHCAAGTQRTGAVVALYRMLVQGASPRSAYEEAKRYDWHPRRDAAWAVRINGLMPRIAQGLVDRGVIDRVPDPLPVMPHAGNPAASAAATPEPAAPPRDPA